MDQHQALDRSVRGMKLRDASYW